MSETGHDGPREVQEEYVPKEFPPTGYKIDTVDRYGWESHVHIEIDPRWVKVNVRYNFEKPNNAPKSSPYPFEDDHLREINKHFKTVRGRPCGRDDRTFFFERPPEVELEKVRLEKLLKEKKGQLVALAEKFKLPRTSPHHPAPFVDTVRKAGTESYYDDNSRRQFEDRPGQYGIRWYSLGEDESVESAWLRTDQFCMEGFSSYGGMNQSQVDEIVFKFNATGEMPEGIQKLWEDFQQEVRQKTEQYNRAGGTILSREIKSISDELQKFSTIPTVDINVQLLPPTASMVRPSEGLKKERLSEPSVQEPTKNTQLDEMSGSKEKEKQVTFKDEGKRYFQCNDCHYMNRMDTKTYNDTYKKGQEVELECGGCHGKGRVTSQG